MTSSAARSVIISDDAIPASSSQLQLEVELARLDLEKREITTQARLQEYTRRIRALESKLYDSNDENTLLKKQLMERDKKLQELAAVDDTISKTSCRDLSIHEARLNSTILSENSALRKRLDGVLHLVSEVFQILHPDDPELVSAWSRYAKSTDDEPGSVARLMNVASTRQHTLAERSLQSHSVQTDNEVVSPNAAVITLEATLESERTAHSFEIQAHRKTKRRLKDAEQRQSELTKRLETILDGPQLRGRIKPDGNESLVDARSQAVLCRVWDLKKKLDVCISELDETQQALKESEEAHCIVVDLHEKHINHLRSAIEKVTGQPMAADKTYRAFSSIASRADILDAEANFYHDQIDSQLGMLRQEIACLKNEKDSLELQLRLTRESMHDDDEFCKLLTKSAMAAEELKKSREDATQRSHTISLLHDRIVHLNHEVDIYKNELNTMRESMKRCKSDLGRKDTLIKEVTRTRSEVDDARQATETRCKGLASSVARLERECRDLKSKMDKLHMENSQLSEKSSERESYKEQVGKLKQEVQRKEVMIDRWKVRAEDALQECAKLRESKSSMVDPSVHATALEARKSAESTARLVERELEHARQQMNVLEGAVDRAVIALASNCANSTCPTMSQPATLNEPAMKQENGPTLLLNSTTTERVSALAKEISEKILGLDYRKVLSTPQEPMGASNVDYSQWIDSLFRN
ncbi:hypothetical protein SeMB42_g00032 [Synchytrium endobioticum]|uniref:Uncharacterized protein n=1 Tax=Synchytrium endobioticum TaxID=286115 RepID=A0A507DA80_9FUNG|nr:hypothetical protein SeLEV6574_g02044 [Synchytrium endobioticum]TPX55042.1 hypothetical protein SeMB42_g00032 [Synchytrium endobioticum]